MRVLIGLLGVGLGVFLALAGVAPFVVGFSETPLPYSGVVHGTAALAMGAGWLGLSVTVLLGSCSVLLPRWTGAFLLGAKAGAIVFGIGLLLTVLLEVKRVYG